MSVKPTLNKTKSMHRVSPKGNTLEAAARAVAKRVHVGRAPLNVQDDLAYPVYVKIVCKLVT